VSIVGVEYPWLPLKCKDCSAFGHAASNQEETSKEVPKVNVTKDRSIQNPWV
jgi:hypothetical protein